MDEELIQEYLRRFDQAFSLLPCGEEPSVWFIELTEDFLRDNQQTFADRMLQDGCSNPDVFSSGALIFYGYRLGAVRLKGKNECYTRQGGYMDNAIWNYNLDEILDEETDDDNPDAGASHIIEWTTNPGSNTDVSEDVIGKMIVPMVKNLCKITPPGKRPECTVVMPPISRDIEIQDWSAIFAGVRAKELTINIVNYGQLLKLDNNKRQYILQYQTDGFREYVVVAAYEVIRGHNTCLGCMAFDVEDSDHQYKLQDIKPISLNINIREERYKRKPKEEKVADWEYLDCKYPVSSGFNSFLGNHEASFGREIYKLSGLADAHGDVSALTAIFRGNEALQPIDVCTRLVGEQNLYNIALGDLVYVANVLQRRKEFKKVSIGTSKKYKLGTYKNFASFVDINMLHRIPSNYASISWKVRDKRKTLVPYFSLDAKKHSEKQIIEAVVDHFEHCSTEAVAEELLYLYKNGEDPSAFFVAKVFMYLSQMDSLEIESRNELVVSIENVDDIEYQEIDKTHIKVSKPVSSVTQKSTIFKERKERSVDMDFPIDKMEFTVRTYNSLRRAGIRTVGEITRKTRSELMKLRNFGRNSQEEVVTKLKSLGLKLADE